MDVIIKLKECNICRETKQLSEYYSYEKSSKTKGEYTYYYPYCKTCSVEKSKKRMYENYDDHKKAAIKSNNRPEARERHRGVWKRYVKSGKYKEWQQKNKDKLKGYNEFRKMNKEHEISDEEWIHCKIFFGFRCAYCGITEEDSKKAQGQYLHKEHVIHDGSNKIDNCVPSCRSCNSSKRQMSLEEFCEYKNIDKERYIKILEWLHSFKLS